ncbi:unnamed protein product [Miscanthus lutarioriparius]|uniref:F-box domain-containing protein n=1 Tax=Miscanthus lutarioriparius TaxID=422564 RepID=A0A811PHV6_9POAL|nr:unnamed protein product [Miscanthus lutarioriparius]
MADDPVDIVTDEVDKISGLPDDVLLDILGRLAMAGDVRTVARTSILSRRWRSLPWPQIPTVSLDVGEFFRSDDDEWRVWRRSRRQHRFVEQHQATAGLTDALARFLAAPPSARVIETLSLKLILTRRDYVSRVGELVGAAADAGAVKTVELELVTEMEMAMAMASVAFDPDALTKLGYGERFRHFLQDCPGAFRSLTKLNLQNLWFDDPAEVNNLVRGCHALQRLSLSSCVLCPKALLLAMDDDDDDDGPPRLPMLTIDAPQSRLQTLVCEHCIMGGVELVQAPELVTLEYNAGGLFLQDYHPVSIGCAPSLQRLGLYQYQHEDSFF